MATALFISREDLVRNTLISGSLDVDKFIQFISIAQTIHVQNFTGTKLYDAISEMIINNTLTVADNPCSFSMQWLSIFHLQLTQ